MREFICFLLLFTLTGSVTSEARASYLDPTIPNLTWETSDEIRLYPNPAGDYFSLENAINIQKLEIINVVGRSVKTFINMHSLDNFYIGDLSTGLYMVRIIDDSGKVLKTIRLHKK
jgi:hypothetical protein